MNTNMALTQKVVNKNMEIEVLAVTAAGLVALESLEIHSEHCGSKTDNDSEQETEQILEVMFKEIVVFIGSILCLVFSLAAFMIFSLYYRTKKVEQNVEHAVLKPIIKETANLPPIFKENSVAQTAVYDAVYPKINFDETQQFLPISDL